MKVLVVGSGGREHALVEALAASPLEPEMYAAPGNVGISRIAESVDIPVDDLVSLRDFAADSGIGLTVVGPETPLIGGISEAFWEADLKVFGPSRAAARIEGSKVFAKELMRHAGVPTARFEARSEEHTSELQSRQYLVCRLLLEKKKTEKHTTEIHSRQYLVM